MIRRLIVALTSMALALGVGVASSTPASAHWFDNTSLFYCAYWRLEPMSDYLVAHSYPIFMNTQTVIYRCEITNLTDRWQYAVWVSVSDGSSTYSNLNFCEPGNDPTPCVYVP